jgi:hypothetical protein
MERAEHDNSGELGRCTGAKRIMASIVAIAGYLDRYLIRMGHPRAIFLSVGRRKRAVGCPRRLT